MTWTANTALACFDGRGIHWRRWSALSVSAEYPAMSLLGLDVGTSGCKGLLLGAGGRAFTTPRLSYELSFPRPGWIELAAEQVYKAVGEAIVAAGAAAVRWRDPIRAIALSVSGDEGVPVDAAGVPLYPCMMSLDSRSTETARRWGRTAGPDRLYEITGLPVASNWPLVRLLWLRENEPDIFARTERFLCWEELIGGWLGVEPVTDVSLASRTMAFDITSRRWSAELADASGLTPTLFPTVRPSGCEVGLIPEARLRDLDLTGPVSVVTGGFDQSMAALGAGLRQPGDAVVGTGTWEALTVLTSSPGTTPPLREAGYAFGCHVVDDLYYCLATNSGGGAVLHWYVSTVLPEFSADALRAGRDPFAAALSDLPDGPSGLVALPHFEGSYNPWMDPDASGAIIGLRLDTTRQQIAAALLEGVTFELRENMLRLQAAGVSFNSLRATGGGAKSAAWLQMKADITGVPISTTNITETGCFAAACLAGVGIGEFDTLAGPLEQYLRITRTYEPRPALTAAYEEPFQRYRHVYAALRSAAPTVHECQKPAPLGALPWKG